MAQYTETGSIGAFETALDPSKGSLKVLIDINN